MKIQRGIKGIGSIDSALEEHFLISCEMSQITEAFLESLHFNSDKINREDHYQLTGRTNKRITYNVGKLKEVMKSLWCNLWQGRFCFEYYFKAYLARESSWRISWLLDIRKVGENMNTEFCSERLKGDQSIWDHMKKKKNLPTHSF